MDDSASNSRSLTIRTNIVQTRLVAELSGYLDSESLLTLREFLDRASTDVTAGIVRDFEFDTAQLYLMSSSAISCLAGWVNTIRVRFPASRIKFHTNHALAWQQRALASIRRLAPESVSVE